MIEEQDAISNKTIKQTEKQLRKYYAKASKDLINEFEQVYDKVLTAVAEGKEVTPAWLYQLDRYWQLQNQLKQELTQLGDKEIELLTKNFQKEYIEIYNSIALPTNSAFARLTEQRANSMINAIWCADGKNFSQRIWKNTEYLTQTLNEELVNCVVTGKKTTQLKQKLIERFNVSYNQSNRIVRTEIAHIQNTAAADRYKDAGVKKFKVLGREEDDIGCECKKLNGTIWEFDDAAAPKFPLHCNCRCTIAPVIE